jgi:hypothetical protein
VTLFVRGPGAETAKASSTSLPRELSGVSVRARDADFDGPLPIFAVEPLDCAAALRARKRASSWSPTGSTSPTRATPVRPFLDDPRLAWHPMAGANTLFLHRSAVIGHADVSSVRSLTFLFWILYRLRCLPHGWNLESM